MMGLKYKFEERLAELTSMGVLAMEFVKPN